MKSLECRPLTMLTKMNKGFSFFHATPVHKVSLKSSSFYVNLLTDTALQTLPSSAEVIKNISLFKKKKFHTLEEEGVSFLVRSDGVKLNTVTPVWQSTI